MIERFLLYGFIGWGMEIVWTGLHSLFRKDMKLTATTSLWMFPIYGMVVFLEPVFILLANMPLVLRGGVYMMCIFMVEYTSGFTLQRTTGFCPWDYGGSKYNIDGYIRMDYAPVWFGVGLLYERLFTIINSFI